MYTLLLNVFIGGGLGSFLRFISNTQLSKYPQFPYSTLFVNLLGSFLIGIFFAFSQKYAWSEEAKALLIAGFLGGLTTFSSFSLDTLKLIQNGDLGYALLNLSLNNFMGILLAWLGYVMIQKILC